MPEQAKKPNALSRIYKWLRELRSELKKIIWPTGKQVVNNTIIVIVSTLLVGALIWIVDFVFTYGRDILISLK